MSKKPILITPELIRQMTNEFHAALTAMKVANGSVSYSREIAYEDDKRTVNVRFTPEAYFKMVELVRTFTTEVAWHGTVTRLSDRAFLITDILVYPQTVTGGTVNTDQEEYQKWMNELDDDTFNSLRFQGHSHANMNAFCSGDDLSHQQKIVSTFNQSDQFYIFMVINRRLEQVVKVYDMATNTLYDDDSVSVTVDGVDCDLGTFIKESKAMVSEKKYTAGRSAAASGYPYNPGSCWTGSHYPYGYGADIDDDDDDNDSWPVNPGSASKSSLKNKSGAGKGAKGKGKTSKGKQDNPLGLPLDNAPGYDEDDDEYPTHSQGSIWQDIQS